MQSGKDAPDWINDLCDDVILRILSLLTVKQAAATSVLSKRWKYLWMASLTCLVFDKDEFSDMDVLDFKKMIDYVVHHFPKGMPMWEFCVRFDLDESSKSHIDDWLDLAFRVGTTRVELNLVENKFKLFPDPAYSVPVKLFHDGSRLSVLRELFLIHVDMDDLVFEAIITTCASLECLVVVENDQLLKAKCTIPHLKLKRLTMDCRFLESLEIIAPNLVSFWFYYSEFKMSGISKTRISIKGARPLVNLNIIIMSVFMLHGDFVFDQFSAYISRLKCLTLDTTTVLERIMAHGKVPCLHNLTTLSLVHNDRRIPYKRAAISMLEASPLLQRFELHLPYRKYDFNLIEDPHDTFPMLRYQELKKIMLSGFRGVEEDMGFLSLIVEYTAVLESVEITTNFVDYYEVDKNGSYRQTFDEDKSIHNRSEYIEELRSNLLSMLPSNISLALLDD